MNLRDKLAYAMRDVNNIQGHTDEPKETRLGVLKVLKEHIERAEELVKNEKPKKELVLGDEHVMEQTTEQRAAVATAASASRDD